MSGSQAPLPSYKTRSLNIGIVGGGLGGLAAAIACARAGANVTILEAAPVLAEIGAGIQMFGNVSRFLIRTGVDEIIGENLVQMDEVRTWSHGPDQSLLARLDVSKVVKAQGFPWWVVRRDHLHAGLAEGARRHGVKLIVDFRASELIQHGTGEGQGVTVKSEKGQSHRFDLVVGGDGVKSFIRRWMFPDIKPVPASNIAAFRSVLPYEEVFAKIPEAKIRIGYTMDLWGGPGGYILLYPLTGGKELNVVTCFEQSRPVTELEEISVQEFRDFYRGWDPFILKILDMVKETKKWPLLTIPRVEKWSNKEGNIVLMGDAIHAMQNHMAQGAATAMEDGIFLGRIISEVLRGTIDLPTGIHLYEKKRIPRAFHKAQSAFVQGQLYSVSDPHIGTRNASISPEVKAWERRPGRSEDLPPTYRTPQLFSNPWSVPSIIYYDAEGDADFAVDEWLMNRGDVDSKTLVSHGLRSKWWNHVWDNGMERWNKMRAKL